MIHILVVDDEASLREMLSIFLETQSYRVTAAHNIASAKSHVAEQAFDLILSDLRLPDGTGMELLKHIRTSGQQTPFIMMTAHATTETAVEAMKNGAFDYIIKPFQLDEVAILVERALELDQLKVENKKLKQIVTGKRQQLTGSSEAIQEIRALVKQVAPTRTTVLITGESGTGKEQVARAIHQESLQADGPFIAVNCGAISESLIEAELFGYKKGAFTGAHTDRAGFFEEAHDGTIFLDEIGELPLNLQVHLLRVLEEKTIRRVGESTERPVNCRVIAATNVDLEEAVRQKSFREDLLFRLNIIHIEVPPLRRRKSDIPELLSLFLMQLSAQMERSDLRLDTATIQYLQSWDWPGNIRELRNVLERACVLSQQNTIEPDALPKKLRDNINDKEIQSSAISTIPQQLPDDGIDLEHLLENIERKMIIEALEKTGGKKMKAAELLGLSFRSFRYRASKLGLD